MLNSAAFVVAHDDILAAADTFAAAADIAVVHTAAADTVVGIAVGAAGSSVVAHSTAALDIAGTVVAVGFVGVYLHPYKHGPRLWTACRSALLSFFQPPPLLLQVSLGS